MTEKKGGMHRPSLAGNPYRLDPQGFAIPGGVEIANILNVALVSTAFRAVTLPCTIKAFMARCRSGGNFLVSHLEAGTPYYTATGPIALDLAAVRGAILFYAQSVAATDTLEVILID